MQSRHSRRPWVLSEITSAALGAVVLLGAVAAQAVTLPFATFNRLTWAPDGAAFAVEMSTVALDVSATSPVRVDTLLVDPLLGVVRCASPRVETFALSPRGDSILFADACGAYIMPADGGAARQIIWRQPSSDVYVRRVGFAADGQFLAWTGCLTELAMGCNEEWVVDRGSQSAGLTALRGLQPDGARPPQTGKMPDLVRLLVSSRTPSPVDAGPAKTAFGRALARALHVVTPAKGLAPDVTLLFTRQVAGTPRWIISAGLYRKRPFVSRTACVVYTPATHVVHVLESEATLVGYLGGQSGTFWYNTTAGRLSRVTVPAADAAPRSVALLPDAHVAWARVLAPAGLLSVAEAFGLADPTRADELAASLVGAGYHAWPIADGAGKWGTAVGFYGTHADAESTAAYLVTQGYESRVRDLAVAQARGQIGSRVARYERAKAPAGALEGSEAILEVASDPEVAACTVLLRRRGQDPLPLFTGYDDQDPQALPRPKDPR